MTPSSLKDRIVRLISFPNSAYAMTAVPQILFELAERVEDLEHEVAELDRWARLMSRPM